MKSLLKVLVLPSLILVLGSVGGPNVASGAYAYRTPRYAGQTYNAGDHQLRFIQATVRGINFTVNELSAEARRIVNAARASNAPTHVWDDNWYQKFVPENGSEYLLIIAHDLTAGRYSWVAVKNSPSKWTVMDNHGNISHPRNGENVKATRTFNGRRVDLDIRNPDNADRGFADHGLLNSDEDIYYSFGY